MNVVVIQNTSDRSSYSHIFGDETVFLVDKDMDMYDLLVFSRKYKTKGEAKRSWFLSGRPIPYGFNTFKLSESEDLKILFPKPLAN